MLRKMVHDDVDAITAATVYEAANKGDALALEVVRDTAKFLGTGVANLLNVFNPVGAKRDQSNFDYTSSTFEWPEELLARTRG